MSAESGLASRAANRAGGGTTGREHFNGQSESCARRFEPDQPRPPRAPTWFYGFAENRVTLRRKRWPRDFRFDHGMPRLVWGVSVLKTPHLNLTEQCERRLLPMWIAYHHFQESASERRCIRAERAYTRCRKASKDGAREKYSPSIAQGRKEFQNRRREGRRAPARDHPRR